MADTKRQMTEPENVLRCPKCGSSTYNLKITWMPYGFILLQHHCDECHYTSLGTTLRNAPIPLPEKPTPPQQE